MTRSAAPMVIVGMSAEARIARRLGWPVMVGGGTEAGAREAARDAIRQGAVALVSFGLAGGLDPALRPGAVVIPASVLVAGRLLRTDPALSGRLGGITGHVLLADAAIAATAAAKSVLRQATGAAAVDLESGAVALTAEEHGRPFGVLRAICDPAGRDLPPAALGALDQEGMIGIGRIIRSLISDPGQLPALLRLATDAAAARRALLIRIRDVSGRHEGGYP